ncbi:MAG TPA: KOW motif-containing protein, partial [Thermoguttaceae bacterium]
MALLCGWFILSPIYYDRGLKNGAPFREGDMVRILVGPHRDRIVKVYAMWQGNTVRVELGDKEKREFKDIFSPAQLLREENAEQDA